MYGVVLMMALSGAGEAPQCHYSCGCYSCGCYGCSCYGCSCYGCSCYGGYGGHGRHGHGCYGCSCYGYSCYSCSCYGCSCYGCSCYGGYGCSCYGGYGCSCYGCYGCSCYGASVYGYYGPTVDGGVPVGPTGPPAMGAPGLPPTTPPGPPAPPMPHPGKTSAPSPLTNARTPATIQVSVPAQTVLYFDGIKMTSTSTSRRFSTPPLETGKTYFYNVRAEVERDGQTVTTTQRVVVRAGEMAQIQINFNPTGSLVSHQD
jgi:uncharacterized protein (TIGR03000 family)